MYLGQKDAQQCVVIKQMVQDLNIPVKVTISPTQREKDGLALSSRNQYLSVQQRQEASVLYKSLRLARQAVRQGHNSSAKIIQLIRKIILEESSGKIDYIACVDAQTLQPIKTLGKKSLIALAVRFGEARLIDNIFL